MSDKTRIAWTQATWNPVSGCSHASPGCDNCYAEALSHRFRWTVKPWTAPNAAENVTLHPERLTIPLRWRKPRRIFVASMGDLFHEQVPDRFLDDVFWTMSMAPQHTFQILTKRPERVRRYISDPDTPTRIQLLRAATEAFGGKVPGRPGAWPLPSVWLGVTAEDQRRADERIPLLLQTPAALRFVSAEPLLGELSLQLWLPNPPGKRRLTLSGYEWETRLDWIIAGAESGPKARPAKQEWFRYLRDQCAETGTPFFLKQMMVDGRLDHEPTLDSRTYRQFPERTA